MPVTSKKPVERSVLGARAYKATRPAVASGDWVTEETHFTQDVAQLTATSPDWDRKTRVNAAVRRLRGGMSPETAAVLFGQDVLASAQLRLATASATEVASDAQIQLKAVAEIATRHAPASSANAVALVRAAVDAVNKAFEAVRSAAVLLESEASGPAVVSAGGIVRRASTRKVVAALPKRAEN